MAVLNLISNKSKGKNKMIKEYLNDYLVYEDGRIFSKKRNRFLNGGSVNGYRMFSLRDKENNKTIMKLGHRLIWELFVGDIPAHLEIDHIDNKRDNNHINNLRIVSVQFNRSRRDLSKLKANGKSIKYKMRDTSRCGRPRKVATK